MEKSKLYCYVDESGHDTLGRIFIVSVVVVKREKDELLGFCELCEKESGKKGTKWRKDKKRPPTKGWKSLDRFL